jgi:hypothetical protein
MIGRCRYSSPLYRICSLDGAVGHILSAPRFMMRQHQIAYRPKTNTYDAFDLSMMRREIIELALFGMNAVEVISTATRPYDATRP